MRLRRRLYLFNSRPCLRMSWLLNPSSSQPYRSSYHRLSIHSAASSFDVHSSSARGSTSDEDDLSPTVSSHGEKMTVYENENYHNDSDERLLGEGMHTDSSAAATLPPPGSRSHQRHSSAFRDRIRSFLVPLDLKRSRQCSAAKILGLLVCICLLSTVSLIFLIERRMLAKSDASATDTSFYQPSLGPPVPTNLPRRPQPLLTQAALLQNNAAYIEAWVARGEVLPGLDFSDHATVDGLWFWVNGSDARHHAARNFYAQSPGRMNLAEGWQASLRARPLGKSLSARAPLQNAENRFREHDELRYSLRSAKKALGRYLRTSHLVTTDFWPSGLPQQKAPSSPSSAVAEQSKASPRIVTSKSSGRSDVFHIEAGLRRHGQLPQWLDVDAPGVMVGDESRAVAATGGNASSPVLKVHHDWSVSAHLRSVDAATQAVPEAPSEQGTLQRKLLTLPTFNSLAAESSLGINVPGLAENFFYSNDDMFLDAPLSPSDFFSPLYGMVLHVNKYFPVTPAEHPRYVQGETPSMQYSAWLLGRRFGMRTRHYVLHVQKVHSTPLLHETRMMWGDDFAQTALRRFRGSGLGANSHLLSYNMIIERHREALLWSYFVSKLDANGDGVYSDEELRAAFGELGYDTKHTDDSFWPWALARKEIPVPKRDTLLRANIKKSLEDAKYPAPLASTYQFSSQDGYLLSGIRYDKVKQNQWPTFFTEPGTPLHDVSGAAIMSWSVCWPLAKARNPVDLFKHMAFVHSDCGDFLITMLMSIQGRKGLEIFLPKADARFPDVETLVAKEETTPHLPLQPRWDDCEFDLESIARYTGWPGESRRLFSMRLIQRYSYTVAGAPMVFQMLTTPLLAKNIYKSLEAKEHAFVGLNDDVEGNLAEQTFADFRNFLERHWPTSTDRLSYEAVGPSGAK